MTDLQAYEATTTPEQGPPRLAALRAEMARRGVDAVLVPRADRFQGEYVAEAEARLAWLTGFTGSAGFAVVTADEAALFVDGRYTVQARAQTADEIASVPWPRTKLHEWLAERMEAGTLAYDPWLHTEAQIASLRKTLPEGVALAPQGTNPIDAVWADRPAPPAGRVEAHPVELSGEPSPDKRARIARILREAGQTAFVITQPDSLCWLLNVRGSDIPRVPIVHAFAILHADARVELFVRDEQVAHLGPDPAIDLRPPETFAARLAASDGPVRVDADTAPAAVFGALRAAGVEIVERYDPIAHAKALKNPVERGGARAAHLRDGAAMVRFLAWLDAQGAGTVTEIGAARALEGFRSETNALRDLSFETISGAGPNGAIVHYRVTEGTDRTLDAGLYLVDSGGQYVDGTTDVTRTVLVGDAPPEGAMDRFTAVLRGMIAVSRARFPRGLAGRDLDPLARQWLWARGRDYDHGTGHGVGSYLSVHEGPAALHRRSNLGLEPGMILSNEPGSYEEGAYGIRTENLILVEPAGGPEGRDLLGFETLTLVPIDRRLIDAAALSAEEAAWLDAYHARVAREIGPLVEGAARDWLMDATRPL